MTSTPRRDASKASKPGYAPVANQSTPALPARGEPAWSEPSPVKASYLADGQSADASLSGTQVRAPPPLGPYSRLATLGAVRALGSATAASACSGGFPLQRAAAPPLVLP